MDLLSALTLGFFLGMRHATDADHVAAVSTIVSRTRRFGAAWLLGAFWGLGHSATIFLVGVAIIVFKVAIPPRVGLGMEFFAGLVLIALGALSLFGAPMVRVHRHGHGHGREGARAGRAGRHAHTHAHWLRPAWLRSPLRTAGRGRLLRALAVGLAHGLAGSAAVALLVLAAMPTPAAAVAYLLVFGLGTLAGMLLLGAALELPMVLAARRAASAGRAIALACGALSLALGLYAAWRAGVSDGLLLAGAPRWTPR